MHDRVLQPGSEDQHTMALMVRLAEAHPGRHPRLCCSDGLQVLWIPYPLDKALQGGVHRVAKVALHIPNTATPLLPWLCRPESLCDLKASVEQSVRLRPEGELSPVSLVLGLIGFRGDFMLS